MRIKETMWRERIKNLDIVSTHYFSFIFSKSLFNLLHFDFWSTLQSQSYWHWQSFPSFQVQRTPWILNCIWPFLRIWWCWLCLLWKLSLCFQILHFSFSSYLSDNSRSDIHFLLFLPPPLIFGCPSWPSSHLSLLLKYSIWFIFSNLMAANWTITVGTTHLTV